MSAAAVGSSVPDRPWIDVWMRWEADRLNVGTVVRPKTLHALLAEPSPRLTTREGEDVELDRSVLNRIAGACRSPNEERLRLPITLHITADVSDSAYVRDELAAEVLRRLEGWGPAYPYRDGKMWIPLSIAMDLVLRYRGAVQPLLL